MEYRWALDWALLVVWTAVLLFTLRDSIRKAARRIFGGAEKPDPSDQQTALLAGIKSLLQEQSQRAQREGQAGILADEWRKAVAEQTAASHAAVVVLSQIRDFADETRTATSVASKDGEKALAWLNQIRDRLTVPPIVFSNLIQQMQQDSAAHLELIRSSISSPAQEQVVILGKILEQLEKNGQQLEKNDQRLADFVGATRRIMRAMEGNSETDEDTQLFEEAKLIQDRAASKGVILTPEDALKRAREQRSYSLGSR